MGIVHRKAIAHGVVNENPHEFQKTFGRFA